MNVANPFTTFGTTNPFPAPQPPPSTTAINANQSWLTYDPFRGFQDPRTSTGTWQWNSRSPAASRCASLMWPR